LILEIAASTGLSAEEGRLGAADLEAADELFLTNAVTGIRPVREIDGLRRERGPVTRRLQARLAAHFAGELKSGAGDD
ncbi:MAG: aminotransferase class IV, partial [Sinobacteraceae bacterium]|nr:aminotransferase class IV [Nevskiaceae bacterium]